MSELVAAANLTEEELVSLMRKVELRVGRMISVERHPNAEKLYIEKVDFGQKVQTEGEQCGAEAELKTVVSGLVPYFTEDQMKGRLCVFVTNLKPAAMRGVVSQAMVLVAKDRDSEGRLEFVCPPESCPPGSIIEVVSDPSPEPVLNPKKKIFENVQPHFGVCPQSGVVQFLGKFAFKVGQDYVTVPTIRNAIIS